MASGSSSKSDKEMRFSDEKLCELADSVETHRIYCEEQFTEGKKLHGDLMSAQLKNTEAIAALIGETREIVQLYADAKGTIRMGKGMQTFGLWVMKWPLIGLGVYAFGTWVMKQFS